MYTGHRHLRARSHPLLLTLRRGARSSTPARSHSPGPVAAISAQPQPGHRAILQGLEIDPHNRPQTVENWLTMLQQTERVSAKTKGKQTLRLPAPPPPQLTLLAFFVTAAIAGWMGFDLAWRYNSSSLSSNRPKIESFPSLEDLLKSRDLSGPMFRQPSVESSPLYPIELNKLPKPTPDSSNIPEQIDPSETSAEPSESPSPETPAPEPEAEPEPSPTPEPQEQPSESPIPEPQTQIEPAPQPDLAPVPEVAPLPPEAPSAPAPPTPGSAETLPPSESAPPVIASPIERSPEPPIPSRSDSNSDSTIAPYSPPPVADPTVPFPEPATN